MTKRAEEPSTTPKTRFAGCTFGARREFDRSNRLIDTTMA